MSWIACPGVSLRPWRRGECYRLGDGDWPRLSFGRARRYMGHRYCSESGHAPCQAIVLMPVNLKGVGHGRPAQFGDTYRRRNPLPEPQLGLEVDILMNAGNTREVARQLEGMKEQLCLGGLHPAHHCGIVLVPGSIRVHPLNSAFYAGTGVCSGQTIHGRLLLVSGL